MKPVGAFVTLRSSFGPEDDWPHPGDCFVTSTGRKYLILGVKGKRFDCVVVKPDHALAHDAVLWHWCWNWKSGM